MTRMNMLGVQGHIFFTKRFINITGIPKQNSSLKMGHAGLPACTLLIPVASNNALAASNGVANDDC